MSYFDFDEQQDEFYQQGLLLAEVVKRVIEKDANMVLTDRPQVQKKPIVEFMKRMRVSSLEKFDEPTYISVVNYYLTEKDMKNHRAIGAIVLYIGEDYIVNILNKLGYPVRDDDDPECLIDACGTVCNLVAGNFKAGLTRWGYDDLVMSHFMGFRNDILNGVEYDPREKDYYEMSFHIKNTKMIMAELTLGNIHRQKWGKK